MEPIKKYISNNLFYCLGLACFILFLIGFVCYSTGQRAAERSADIQRVQSTEKQLDETSKQLTEAINTNQSARDVIESSKRINSGIQYSVDRSADAVNNSKVSNQRTANTITEAERIVRDAKSTADENERIAGESRAILDRALARSKTGAGEGAQK